MTMENHSDPVAEALEAAFRLAREIHRGEDGLPPRLEPADESLADLAGLRLNDEGHDFDEVVEALRKVMLATPSAAGRGFFNQLFGGRDPVATMAEMLTPMVNTSMYTFKVAGPQILLEREVLARMLERAGLDGGEGAFVPGGSMANMVAMVIARNRAFPEARNEGQSGLPRLIAYTSDQSHYSIQKNAGLIGLGRSNVRLIETDDAGRLRPDRLAWALEADRDAGHHPYFLNATAGTTVLGAYDPIAELAEVAAEHSLWLHVDGAFGATALLSERHRHLLNGVGRADSLTWDAHKLMGVPLSCSMILLKEKGLLEANLNENASYLFQADADEFNPGTRSLQCGRRNDALKLWAAWLYHGDRGWDRKIGRLFDLAAYTAGRIEEDPDLHLVVEPEGVNVCFTAAGRPSEAVCDRLDEESLLKIGHGLVGETSAIRLVCTSPSLTEERIDDVLETIKKVAQELPPG